MASNILPISLGPTMGAWGDGFTRWFPEGASQTYIAGAPLKFSSGTLVVISSVTAPTIVGIAIAKATGTTGTASNPNCPVTVPLAEVLWVVSVDTTTTTGTAALGTGKPSDFTIGTNYQLLLDSTSGNYYMGTGTGNAVWQLMGYDSDQASVLNGRVYARILTSQTVWS